jgi:two-component system NtrC family response regulator
LPIVEDRTSALAALRCHEPAVVLQALGLPPDPQRAEEGLATCRETLMAAPRMKVIAVTGKFDRGSAVRAVGHRASCTLARLRGLRNQQGC